MAREYKDSDIEWIGLIPKEWKLAALKQIGTYINGYAFKPEDWTDSGKPIIRIQDLTGSMGSPNFYNGELDSKYLVSKGDILVSWAATLDAFVWEKNEGWLNQHIFKALPSSDVNYQFFYWLIKLAMENMNNDNKHGIVMQHVTTKVFGNFVVSIPSIDEQQKIAYYLDKVCGEVDEMVALQETMIEELKAYKQSVITEAVTKGLNPNAPMKDSGIDWIGEIPENWKVIRIKYLLKERKERSDTGLEEPLSMSQKYGLIPTKEMDAIPNIASSFVGAKLVYRHDLVFNKLKAHLGVFAESDYDGLVSPDYAVYYSSGLVDVKYLEYLFKSPQYIAEFIKLSTGVGAGLTRLYTSDLYSIYGIVPPIEIQREIVDYIRQLSSEINTLIAIKQSKIEELKEYKKSVIYEYVTGKKEVV